MTFLELLDRGGGKKWAAIKHFASSLMNLWLVGHNVIGIKCRLSRATTTPIQVYSYNVVSRGSWQIYLVKEISLDFVALLVVRFYCSSFLYRKSKTQVYCNDQQYTFSHTKTKYICCQRTFLHKYVNCTC